MNIVVYHSTGFIEEFATSYSGEQEGLANPTRLDWRDLDTVGLTVNRGVWDYDEKSFGSTKDVTLLSPHEFDDVVSVEVNGVTILERDKDGCIVDKLAVSAQSEDTDADLRELVDDAFEDWGRHVGF